MAYRIIWKIRCLTVWPVRLLQRQRTITGAPGRGFRNAAIKNSSIRDLNVRDLNIRDLRSRGADDNGADHIVPVKEISSKKGVHFLRKSRGEGTEPQLVAERKTVARDQKGRFTSLGNRENAVSEPDRDLRETMMSGGERPEIVRPASGGGA